MTIKRKGKRAKTWYEDIFIADEEKDYDYALGTYIASGFSGFIAGLLVASIVFIVIIQAMFGK